MQSGGECLWDKVSWYERRESGAGPFFPVGETAYYVCSRWRWRPIVRGWISSKAAAEERSPCVYSRID